MKHPNYMRDYLADMTIGYLDAATDYSGQLRPVQFSREAHRRARTLCKAYLRESIAQLHLWRPCELGAQLWHASPLPLAYSRDRLRFVGFNDIGGPNGKA